MIRPALILLTPVLTLVPAPPRIQGLTLDSAFAQEALRWLDIPNGQSLSKLENAPALAHLLRHARHWDYEVPKESPAALATHLLDKVRKQPGGTATLRASLAHFEGPLRTDPWASEVLACLPKGFQFKGATLFLTCGYDIGVATLGQASLNGAHPRFQGHPRELTYYAIHELHHVGYMAFHPPLSLGELRTCGDLLRFVEYSAHMEGMAVWAAYARRERDGALGDDGDYVALGDPERMARYVRAFFAIHDGLASRRNAPLTPQDWALLEELAGGDRLWYRVGAQMARDLERTRGRDALRRLVQEGPGAFFEAHARGAERRP
jgi:hypothetical protein